MKKPQQKNNTKGRFIMSIEKIEKTKNELLIRLYERILRGYTLEELRVVAKKLCKDYFPNSDEVLLESFCSYAVLLQCKYFEEQNLNTLFRNYK